MTLSRKIGWSVGIFAFYALFVIAVLVFTPRQTLCQGQCTHDAACQKHCLDNNYCPYAEEK